MNVMNNVRTQITWLAATAMLATTALTLSSIAARASIVETYECGATKSSPLDNDRDPIIKIKLQIVMHPNKFYSFNVDHYAASGKIYSRQDQYRDRRYWSNDKADSWSGVSVKMPNLTMVGSIKADGHYVEQQFRGGKLQSTTTSACRAIEEESH
jgi:hypothetical protein